jgi:hypothetical protein
MKPVSEVQGGDRYRFAVRKELNMLWTLSVILPILWLLGLLNDYTLGGLIHILFVIAIIGILSQWIRGRQLS